MNAFHSKINENEATYDLGFRSEFDARMCRFNILSAAVTGHFNPKNVFINSVQSIHNVLKLSGSKTNRLKSNMSKHFFFLRFLQESLYLQTSALNQTVGNSRIPDAFMNICQRREEECGGVQKGEKTIKISLKIYPKKKKKNLWEQTRGK